MFGFIENLSKDTTSSKMVIKNSTGVIWLVNKKLNLIQESPQPEPNESKTPQKVFIDIVNSFKKKPDKHVMISYNR